jgi:hypothetical protein
MAELYKTIAITSKEQLREMWSTAKTTEGYPEFEKRILSQYTLTIEPQIRSELCMCGTIHNSDEIIWNKCRWCSKPLVG